MYHVVIATRVVFFKCTFECVIYEFWGFRCSSDGKESTCSAGDLGLIPGSGRSPGEGKGYPLQCSGLENSMDSIVSGVAKSWTRLSDSPSFHFHSLYFILCSQIKIRALLTYQQLQKFYTMAVLFLPEIFLL